MYTIISVGLSLGLGVSGPCAASCAPILALYVAAAEHSTVVRGIYTSLLFSFGRLISYLTLGLLFSFTIKSILNPIITAVATLIVGCLVILHGLSALGIFKIRTAIDHQCKYVETNRSPVYLGLLTGLRPCVPLIAALTYSITLAEVTEVLLFMLSFWVGSSIFIFLIGPLSGGLAGVARRISIQRVRTISGVALIVVGLVLIAQAAGLTIYHLS